jgi:hypothetical protein
VSENHLGLLWHILYATERKEGGCRPRARKVLLTTLQALRVRITPEKARLGINRTAGFRRIP